MYCNRGCTCRVVEFESKITSLGVLLLSSSLMNPSVDHMDCMQSSEQIRETRLFSIACFE